MPSNPVASRRFTFYAWGLLVYMLLTIVWGVFLRASGSGDGCGTHWPLCGDVLIPKFGVTPHKTWIEWIHRFMSEFLGVLILAEVIWAFRAFGKRHPVFFGACATGFFTFTEAWLGRQLVVFKYVAYSEAPERVYWFGAHLTNTFCLVACLAVTAWLATTGTRLQWKNQGPMLALAILCLLSTLGLSITGSISALGDTLYPPQNHLDVLNMAALPAANAVMKARPVHPYSAAVVAMVLCLAAGLFWALRPSAHTKKFAQTVWFLLTLQMVLGLLNIAFLAPIGMQLVHLLAADILWICVVLMCASALSAEVPHVELQHVPEAVLNGEKAKIGDFVALTKPRVISLLLVTTLTAMFIAARGWPGNGFLHGLWLLLATGAGLYAAAGSSNAINMVLERDLDVKMERTASRPCVTEKIHPRTALWFAFGLEIFSFGILWGTSNLLSASLALAGLVVYVIVYTLLLKRRTWSNIVIGGAAGAFPPLVGWAAATGELSPLAWCLFALIFVWTPVHFWALALLIKDDYAKAGVPMLPVVKGDRYTVGQIAFYAVWTVGFSLAPFFLLPRGEGWFYAVCALILNGYLGWGCLKLWQQVDRPRASGLFHYSMAYLALLFLALAIDGPLMRWL